VSASEIYRWARRWQRCRDGKRINQRERWSIRRRLVEIAEPVGRASTIGRPWLWRLKQPVAERHPRRQIEIIGEIGRWPILPILQTMFEGRKGVPDAS
jgi:hypothetical protein